MKIEIPYGKSSQTCTVDEQELRGVLRPRFHEMCAQRSQRELVDAALDNPVGTAPLSELAAGKDRILLITSDHTRPVPSGLTLPLLLRRLRTGSPDADIRILVATGVHRQTTKTELREKFGNEVADRETIVIHDAFDDAHLSFKTTLPSGCEFSVNTLVDWADLIVAEGFIEPHFFAGFSGGRKSILPGIASAKSIMSNHCAALIAHPRARTGVLEGNPIHADMLCAAKAANLAFILNVVLDCDKQVVAAFAGDAQLAHEAGCRYVSEYGSVPAAQADIVITSNGGSPLDQNIYQAVKSMTAAERCVRPGGVIICAAQCADGIGGDAFYHWFADAASSGEVMKKIESIPAAETLPDQWQAQILARVMCRAAVILVADAAVKEAAQAMGMRYCETVQGALDLAKCLKPDYDGITVIPDGVGVIVT